MRNTGSHISNNTYHSNEIRGGEKKVMKKSLSVILSTTMALSAFSTAALAATSKDFSDLDKLSAADKVIFDKLIEDGIFLGVGEGKFGVDEAMKRDQFAVAIVKAFKLTADATTSTFPDVKEDAPELRFIEAAYKAGIANGNKDGTFNPKGEVSVQELAVFLVGALGPKYKEEARAATGNHEGVAPWAQGYVTTALKYNLLAVDVEEGFDGFAAATRYQLAKGVAAAQAKYAEDNKPPYATKVESLKSNNLAQVVVTFDGEVDKASAEEVDNYTISDNRTINTAKLSEDGRSVTLELDTKANIIFTNQKEYKLSISNVKAGDNVINASDLSFTPIDVEIPSVKKIDALGNKAIRVVFSEPIKSALSSSFLIDDKQVVASTRIVSDTVILRLNSALSDGDHTIAVKDVVDFANLKSLKEEVNFTVVADNTPPTVDSVVHATFEKVTLKFSEPVDPDTVLSSNVYWMQGSAKKVANGVKQISDDTFEFDFNLNRIQYTTDLFVTGVKDYSGNVIAADTKIQVNPVIDTVRPEVTSVEYKGDIKTFQIKFNKQLDRENATKAANYVIKNSSGDEVHKYKEVYLAGDNKLVEVRLAEGLEAGKTYTIEISGVTDNTTLKNSILPYTKTITVKDEASPVVQSVVRNNTTNQLIVTFNKPMAISGDGSVTLNEKYTIWVNGTEKTLPDGTSIGISSDQKSAIIQLPTYYNNELHVGNISKLKVQVVKGANGKYLEPLSTTKDVENQTPANLTTAVASDKNKIKLTFSRPLLDSTVSAYDFEVVAGFTYLSVVEAKLNSDGNEITLTLSDSTKLDGNGRYNGNAVEVRVRPNPSTATVDGMKATGSAIVSNKIAAAANGATGNYDGQTIKVHFDAPLKNHATGDYANIGTDFVIKKGSTTLKPGTDYDVTGVSGSEVTITLKNGFGTGVYSIAIIQPRFLISGDGSTVVAALAEKDALFVSVTNQTPTIGGVEHAKVYNTNVTPTFTGTGKLSTDGGAEVDFTSGTEISTNGVHTLKVTGTNGITTTITFTIDKAALNATIAPVTAGNVDQIVVSFNKQLATATTDKVNAADVVGSLKVNGVTDVTVTGIEWNNVGSQANTLTIKFESTTVSSGNSLVLAFVGGAVKDLAGNSSNGANVSVTAALSSAKDITSFKIGEAVGAITGTDIAVEVPAGTDVTAVTPDIVASDKASVTPTGDQDFTDPVQYTVTAEDGSTKVYTVTVTVAP